MGERYHYLRIFAIGNFRPPLKTMYVVILRLGMNNDNKGSRVHMAV